jgi:hypothetical protein
LPIFYVERTVHFGQSTVAFHHETIGRLLHAFPDSYGKPAPGQEAHGLSGRSFVGGGVIVRFTGAGDTPPTGDHDRLCAWRCTRRDGEVQSGYADFRRRERLTEVQAVLIKAAVRS